MSGTLLLLRCAMALVWIYNGLWLKMVSRDAHHLEIVASALAGTGISPSAGLIGIGLGETLLALGILSGLWWRFVNGFQIGLILAMNVAGILLGGGAIENPIGLVISNLPLIGCALAVGVLGPGKWAVGRDA